MGLQGEQFVSILLQWKILISHITSNCFNITHNLPQCPVASDVSNVSAAALFKCLDATLLPLIYQTRELNSAKKTASNSIVKDFNDVIVLSCDRPSSCLVFWFDNPIQF